MANIHEAARVGDVVAVSSFLHADAMSRNARDQHSRTPLHLASWAGHADVVHLLCKSADVGAAAADNMSAIHFASQKGHTQVVRYLLAAGASTSACTRKGMTPLHYAIQGGHIDLAKLLIKKGADLNACNKSGKKAIDLVKDDEVRKELLLTETQAREAKAASKKSKDKIGEEGGIASENVAAANEENEHGPIEDLTEKSNASPPRKKSKVQVSHLGMNAELEENQDGPIEDLTEKSNASPPRKKSKVQLSHLGMDAELEENS